MGSRKKKWERERWYKCPKRNYMLVPPSVCNMECGGPKSTCEYIERRVKKRVA